jgi:hypothetical protein
MCLGGYQGIDLSLIARGFAETPVRAAPPLTPEPKAPANDQLTDDSEQTPAGHIFMRIDAISAEEQQYKKEDALTTTITFEETKTDPKTFKITIIN